MEEELAADSPRTSPSKRGRTRVTRRGSSEEWQRRLKGELYLAKDLIDVDVIKGSAFFHTKPSNPDKKLVKQGLKRALFVPFYASFWRHKAGFYELTTALYVLHATALGIFFFYPGSTSAFSTFEVCFPIALLLLVAINYGRVISTLQTGDSPPTVKLFSPTPTPTSSSTPSKSDVTDTTNTTTNITNATVSSVTDASARSATATVSAASVAAAAEASSIAPQVRARLQAHHTNASVATMQLADDSGASALGSDIAESEASNSTDSDEDSGNSSSSSEERAPRSRRASSSMSFATAGTIHRSSSMPATPRGGVATSEREFPQPPLTPPHSPRTTDATEQFTRRRVTVCVWEQGIARKRAMSVTELRNTILAKVKATPQRMLYRQIAHLSAIALACVPLVLRGLVLCHELDCLQLNGGSSNAMGFLIGPLPRPAPCASHEYSSWGGVPSNDDLLSLARLQWVLTLWREFTSPTRVYHHVTTLPIGATVISVSCLMATYHMASVIFNALADAEATYHRRLMYAKCFTALTSARRSRLHNLPHFRLKNVVNIKAWISLRGGRTWLKRQGRQRAADEIVSTLFLINLVLLAVMGIQAVSETSVVANHAQTLLRLEVTSWCLLSSVFMLRFMMLGSNINKKYQNTSLLLTEQMNVYLRLLVKPHKKEKLLISNNVLKLASKLLKELNSPNKVSGLTMNPLLYNLTRVVVLSAFSSTASEFFGFKLKLWKMKHI